MEAVGEAEVNGLLADPDLPGEKFVSVSNQPISAAPLDVDLEVLVDRVQHVLDDGGIGLVDRTERVVKGLLLSGGQNSPLDSQLADGLVEAERGRDGADAADDGAETRHYKL